MCISTARLSSAIISACCSHVLRPVRDGQSMLLTVAIHTPRNSRAMAGGRLSGRATTGCAAEVAAEVAAAANNAIGAAILRRSGKKLSAITSLLSLVIFILLDVAAQALQHRSIRELRVVPLGSLDHLGDPCETRVVHHVTEWDFAKLAFGNQRVAVLARAESEFRVVEMHHVQPVDVE